MQRKTFPVFNSVRRVNFARGRLRLTDLSKADIRRLIRVISVRYMSRKGRKDPSVIVKKPIPRHKSEDAEREFWATHDSLDYIDWRRGMRVTLPNLKLSSRTISLRLPKPMLDRLKLLANDRDIPYQSLVKMFAAERLTAEFESSKAGRSAAVK